MSDAPSQEPALQLGTAHAQLRLAESADVEALDALARECGLALDAAAELRRECARLWVSGAQGSPKAFLLAWVVADEVEVIDVGTAPGARRQGIARHLIEHLMASARRDHLSALHLEVRESNGAARCLYAACGFEEVGRRPRYYADGEAALLLTWRP